MDRLEASQDAGSMQIIMNQGIDRDQLDADFEPLGANVSGADQNVGLGHGEHFVRNPVDVAQRLDQGIARLHDLVKSGLVVCLL